VLAALAALAVAAGCGSSGGSTGDSAATVAACEQYCDAYLAAACTPSNYTSAADCKMAECHPLNLAPAMCQTKLKAYYDCQKAQADVCAGDTPCMDAFTAVQTCQ